jgi:LacI family transcriptional regulator
MTATPCVLLNALPKQPSPIPSVVPDEVEAGRTAARVLLDAGHSKGIHLIGAGPGMRDVPAGSVAAVNGSPASARCSARRASNWRAATSAVTGSRRTASPPRGLYLEKNHPCALICLNDRLALGAYQALDDFGLSVPADVSVVSFDDHPIASWMRPKLTTVVLPHHELGRTAVDVLFAEMGREGPSVHREGEVHRVAMPVRARFRRASRVIACADVNDAQPYSRRGRECGWPPMRA